MDSILLRSLSMQIKPPSRRHRVIAELKKRNPHWWLVPPKPKKLGRLSQRNKANNRLKRLVGPSEFVIMARNAEESYA